MECGEDDPACLDLHHREPDTKKMKISKMVTWGYSKDKLQAEMDKCDVVCANCHRIEHHTIPAGVSESCQTGSSVDFDHTGEQKATHVSHLAVRQRATVYRYKKARGCTRCGESGVGCLDPHHVDDTTKTDTVSSLISNESSPTDLRAELRKCTVLCANCHRREHYQGPLPE